MKGNYTKYYPYFLVAYHLCFAWIAYDYVNKNNGDAVKYWFVGKNPAFLNWADYLQPGTETIQLITFPFVKYLHLPGWAGCLIFSLFSSYAFLRLWKLLKEIANDNHKIVILSILLLLVPNVHFWTSLIGKEAILFLPVVLIGEQFYKKKYFSFTLLLSFFVLAWIRPHVGFVFLLSFLIALIAKGEISKKTKITVTAISVGMGAGLYFILSKITHANQGLLTKIERLYHIHNTQLKTTSAYVPLDEYSYPYKLFTFYFRPLPFEKKSFHYNLIGIENLLVLVIFLGTVYFVIRNFKSLNITSFHLFGFGVLLFYGTMFAYGYANFGMIIRANSLMTPILILLVASLLQKPTLKNIPPHPSLRREGVRFSIIKKS